MAHPLHDVNTCVSLICKTKHNKIASKFTARDRWIYNMTWQVIILSKQVPKQEYF